MKLTQKVRGEILENYCKEKYHAKVDACREAFCEEITEVVEKHFSDFDFEKAKEFDKYIDYHSRVNIAFYDERWRAEQLAKELFFYDLKDINWGDVDVNFEYPGQRRLDVSETGKAGTEIVKRFFIDITKMLEKFVEEKNVISAVLSSCNTDKQLTETLPEIMQYYPKGTGTDRQLISVQTLNKAKALLGA